MRTIHRSLFMLSSHRNRPTLLHFPRISILDLSVLLVVAIMPYMPENSNTKAGWECVQHSGGKENGSRTEGQISLGVSMFGHGSA